MAAVSHAAAIDPDCELCRNAGGDALWRDEFCRVIAVGDTDYPGFCRVVLNRHVREMTDLTEDERVRLMRVVFAVEAALRALLAPDKINLACLGNQVPHLHWHVVARFRTDRHFPAPIWAAPTRPAGIAPPLDADRLRALLAAAL
jgi:diadenosine tetraphosphate (Ap4A) HIT family hydrolase